MSPYNDRRFLSAAPPDEATFLERSRYCAGHGQFAESDRVTRRTRRQGSAHDRFRSSGTVWSASLPPSFDVQADEQENKSGYAFVESFNGRMRDELLNETLFMSLDHAREKIAAWIDDYINSGHTHRWDTPLRQHSLPNLKSKGCFAQHSRRLC